MNSYISNIHFLLQLDPFSCGRSTKCKPSRIANKNNNKIGQQIVEQRKEDEMEAESETTFEGEGGEIDGNFGRIFNGKLERE
jgi:hypothetical protein